jgi:hypothetical protein
MSGQEVISVIGLLGIGGMLKTFLDHFLGSLKKQSELQQETKETRYKAIILLAYALCNFEREFRRIQKYRSELKTKDDLIYELQAECMNMSLYSEARTIRSMKQFLVTPEHRSFVNFLNSLRKELYGVRGSLKSEDLDFLA